jgi:hypothetical protein
VLTLQPGHPDRKLQAPSAVPSPSQAIAPTWGSLLPAICNDAGSPSTHLKITVEAAHVGDAKAITMHRALMHAGTLISGDATLAGCGRQLEVPLKRGSGWFGAGVDSLSADNVNPQRSGPQRFSTPSRTIASMY